MYVNGNNLMYFDSFGIGHIPKEKKIKKSKNSLEKKNIITNIYRIKAYDLIMCGYFGIEFIDFMLIVKKVLNYTIIFSLNEYQINDKIILKYYQ